MKDPIPTFKPLSDLVQPIADHYNMPTFPLHVHEVLLAFFGYHFIYLISPTISSFLCPGTYPNLKRRTRINWNVHVVSLVQSTFISLLALYVMWADTERSEVEHRVHGYTGIGASVQAYALGYFLWDLMMSARYFEIFGPGFLAHAASACVVYSLGFRPFVNYYAPVFICFELSSPFLNFHWFFDKLNMTGSRAQLVNGLTLLGVFFGCRVVYGPIASFWVFRDIFEAYQNPPMTPEEGQVVPLWLLCMYLGPNIVLNCLNYFWFAKMIDAVRKRFVKPKTAKAEKVAVEGTTLKAPALERETKKEL